MLGSIESGRTAFDFSDADVQLRQKSVGLGPQDVTQLKSLKSLIQKNVDQYVAAFFDYFSDFPDAAIVLARPHLLEQAKKLKHEHVLAMASGDYGRAYVEQRVRLGELYGEMGLEPRLFLGAYHHQMRTIGDDIMKGSDGTKAYAKFLSLMKLSFFDIAIIMDVLAAARQRTILAQQAAIRELSTPVLQLRDRLLILPIIGLIDSQRARQLTDELLRAIRANRSKVVVMDITGVGAVDSKVANHLIQTVAAARLMGANVIVTGLSAEVAQALVGLGVDLGKLNTAGDLQGGLEEAERALGYTVSLANGSAARALTS